jgi:transposase
MHSVSWSSMSVGRTLVSPRCTRAPRGKRAYDKVPRNRGKNTTLIAALTWSGMGECLLLEGSANAVAFERYIETILAPSLHAEQIVLMDNRAAHKGKRREELITAKGCQRLFLPSYSPNFSPIEETFSKLKTYLRRAGARTQEAFHEAIGHAGLPITTQDAQGWFRHCGYLPAAEKLTGRD